MRFAKSWAGLAAGLALSACATMPVVSPPAGPAVPSAPLNLGDWRRASAANVLRGFEQEVAARYRAGLAMSAAGADLRRNDFDCAAHRDNGGRGDPPDQICRRTVTAEGCTHTWQVHLYDDAGALARTRALYDRRCDGEGLLGGPG